MHQTLFSLTFFFFFLIFLKISFVFVFYLFIIYLLFFIQSPVVIIQSTRRELMSIVYAQNVVINLVMAPRIFFQCCYYET